MGWVGTSGSDTYYDTAGSNDLDGKDGDDRLYGLDGNDIFHVSGYITAGFDYFNGGGGYNKIVVDTPDIHTIAIKSLFASDNINEIQGVANPSFGWSTKIGLDWMSGHGSTLDLSNTQLIKYITEINGSSYNDYITGNGQSISINAGKGDDTIYQSVGSDVINGGEGYDVYYANGIISNYNPYYDDGSASLKYHLGSTWQFVDKITGGAINLLNVECVIFDDTTLLSSAKPNSLADADTSPERVSETAANGATVGITARTTDPDGGAITYSLTDNAGGRFAIDAATGVVTVANAALIDYETATSHTITVRATDTTGQYAAQSYTIQVLDGNDAPTAPTDANTALDTVAEGSAAGTAVGITASATDPNAGSTLTYSLTDDAGGRFAINAATGVVTVANASLLDYETAKSHRITVQASDGGLGRTSTFTVAVTNVQDNPAWTGTVAGEAFAASNGDNWTLSGLGGDDTLTGNTGDDTFVFAGTGGGFDAVIGGAGTDTIAATQNGTVIGLRSLSGVEAITAGGAVTGVTISGDAAANVFNLSAVALTGIGKIGGGAGGDAITGNAADNTISGDAGNDVLGGGDGGDTFLFAGTGEGFDAITGGNGTDVIQAVGDGTVIGLSSLATVERITAGSYRGVTIAGNEAANTLNFGLVTLTGIGEIGGGAGGDIITGSGGADTLAGEAGDDTLDGGAGDDVFLFAGTGDGFDALTGGTGADTVRATEAGTVIGLRAINGVEAFTGGGFAGVTIRGGAAADSLDFSVATLTGIAGIGGGGGNDALKGSAGDDVFTFAGTGEGFDAIAGNGGTDTIRATAAGTVIGLTAFTSIEAITGGGNAGVTISGGAGAETFDFTAVALTGIARIDGGAGTDTITGSVGADTIAGGTGGDTLDGGAGNDTFEVDGTAQGFDKIVGGAGYDTIVAASAGTAIGLAGLSGVEAISSNGLAGVTVLGGTAADTMDFSAVALTGIAGIDGGAGGDAITGSAGADVIVGNTGDDTLNGGAGDDTFQVTGAGQGFDRVVGGAGHDAIVATRNDTVLGLSGIAGVETVSGSGYTGVVVQGGTGADALDFSAVALVNIAKIDGGAGADTITGSAGADVIAGGAGKDALAGGLGADVFKFMAATDSTVGAGADLIAGFSVAQGDKIDLSDLDADPASTGNQAFGFVGSAAFTGKGQVRAEVQADGNTHVFGTIYGTTPGFEIVLAGNVTLQASNFVL